MANINAVGSKSGGDISALLNEMSDKQKSRLKPLTTQQASYKAKLMAFDILKTAMTKVETASAALKKADTINTTAVSSTNTAFSAVTNNIASAGTYKIEVSALAQSHSLLTRAVANTADAQGNNNASRTIIISQPEQRASVEITLSSEQTSLTAICDAINKQAAGVSATIIKADDNNYYLALTAKETGTKSVMTVSVTGDYKLNNLLNFTPNRKNSSGAMTQKVAAKDAVINVNGVRITRQTNTITDAPQCVILTLKSVTKSGEAEQLNITRDNNEIKTAIQSWVDSYNSLQTTFASLTKYTAVEQGKDQSTTNGVLLGDNTLRTLQTQLRAQLGSAQSGDLKTLASLGITQDVKGKLSVDSAKLEQALKDKPSSVTAFFTGDGKTRGFATQTHNLLNSALNSTTGIFKTTTEGINKSLKMLDRRITQTTDSIDANIARYKKQFMQINKMISSSDNKISMLTNRLSS